MVWRSRYTPISLVWSGKKEIIASLTGALCAGLFHEETCKHRRARALVRQKLEDETELK